nr:hypothetical protein [uncultured Prevotella sp.]
MNMTLGWFLPTELALMTIKKGSSDISSDKLKLLHIRHTESRRDGGKANITEVPMAQRATEV